MKLKDYPKNIINAAFAAKGMRPVDMARRLEKSPNTIYKAIAGNSTIPSSKLEDSIIEALQPELDKIYEALQRTA